MKIKLILLALGLGIAAGQAQTATIVYQQNWGSGVAPNGTTLDQLGWSAIFAPGGSAGTWASPGAVDAVTGDPLPDNHIWNGGSAGIGVFYTENGAGSGTYGNSAFTSIDPTVQTNLEITVACYKGWQGELTTHYVAVKVAGSWYVSTNHPFAPTNSPGNTYYNLGIFYSPNATNWNTLTISDPVVIGAPAGANLSGTIDGVGIVTVLTGPSWMEYNVLRVSSISSNAPPTPPIWQAGPLSPTNYAGAGVSFAVKASSTVPVSYQWYSNGVALANGGRISGATNSVLTITNISTGDSGAVFSVNVSNTAGSFDTSTNSPATLTVNPLPADVLYAELLPFIGPTAFGGPVSLVGWSNSIPDNLDRLAQTSGGDGFVWSYEGYAWNSVFYATTTSDTGVSGLKFPSINPDAYPAISLAVDLQPGWQAANVSGVYFAVQMGGTDWYISQTPLPVNPNVSTYSTYQQPFDRAAIQWNTLTLSATGATIGGQPAGNLSGNITGAGLVFVNSGAGTMNFDNFVISTNAAPAIAPFIIYPPIPQSTLAGGGASFAVKAGGTQPLTYYWQTNQVTASDGGRLSGTRSNQMTIQNVNAGDQVIYSVIVSNAAGTADSIGLSVSGLTVSDVPAGLLYAEAFPYVGPLPPGANYPMSVVGWANAVPTNPSRLYALDYAGNGAAFSFEGSGPQATVYYATTATDAGASGLRFPNLGIAGASDLTFAVDIAPSSQGSNVTASIAVQINGSAWYVSAASLPVNTSADTATFSTVSQVFSAAAANWKNLTITGTGATIGSTASANLSGDITGAGLVFNYAGAGNFNFKNFQVTGTVLPSTGPIAIGSTTATSITFTWTASPNVHLQSATNVTQTVWTDVPGTAGQSSYTASKSAPQMFYRLVGQ